MFSCSDKTSKTKRLTDDLTARLVASHSLSGNMSRHRLCSQSTSLPSSRPSSNILKKLPIWIPAVFSFNSWPLKQNCLSTSQDRPVAVGIYQLVFVLGVSSSIFTNGNQCQFELLFCLLWMVATQPISTKSPSWQLLPRGVPAGSSMCLQPKFEHWLWLLCPPVA